jgi:hypothetical protein
MIDRHETDADLLARYVATFQILDDLCDFLAPGSLISRTGEYGMPYWRPLQISTPPSALDSLYLELPTRFPPLYEAFILSYRWAKVELGTYRLLPNEPADDLSPLLSAITCDAHMYPILVSSGFLQFGQGLNMNYDPVCFDFRRRNKSGDYRVVQIEHEAILCYDRIGDVKELAPSFRALILDTITRAELMRFRSNDTRD